MENKKRILVVPSDESGCGYYRSVKPHTKLAELYGDEFEVTIEYNPNWSDLNWVNGFDLIHLHKGIFNDMASFREAMKFCKNNNIVIVVDNDDFWDVGQYHPLSLTYKKSGQPEIIKDNLRMADYCTTTTEYFAQAMKKFNSNVKVFVNAIDPTEEQFIPKPIPRPNDRIRFGFIMGSSHGHDMEMLRGVTNALPKEILDKCQFVLCGFDLRGSFRLMNPDGTVKEERPIKPEESVWHLYEKIITDDFKLVSPAYKNFLFMFQQGLPYPNEDNEMFKRSWTKDIKDYATHYNKIDVLLVPLADNTFNSYKSELKLIESGFFSKAVVCSDFGPYKIGTKNLFEKGGTINEEGNVILVDPRKNHKDWGKAITKLVKNPELIDKLGKNLHNSICTKYDLSNVTRERAEWYRNIIKR